jgi:hypothetical protein
LKGEHSVEKFKTEHPLPEGLQRELLVILMEEAAEITQRASKALRFGLDEVQPGQEFSNAQRLAHEIGDLEEVVHQLHQLDTLAYRDVETGTWAKREQLKKYLQNG